MKYEMIDIKAPGQQEGPAKLSAYILDNIKVAPERKRTAVIVVPGGGYWNRSDREQEPVAMRFLGMGCHAFILNYSVSPHRFPVSLQELALSVATIRDHADEWNVDAERILICGFSAGGHLVCSLGTYWNQPVAYEAIGRTPKQVQPNGLILCYPVITGREYRHQGSMNHLLGEDPDEELIDTFSLEKHVTEAMPPVFLWHTLTDENVPVENSMLLAAALRRANVNFEFHIYPAGGHGLSLATRETGGEQESLLEPCCQTWISLVQSWIEAGTA